MKCYSVLLGARKMPSGGRSFSPADDELIRAITFRHFPGGFTILNADGGWFDPSRRKFIEEESRQILVCAPSRRSLRKWCESLAHALNQAEVLVVEAGPATTIKRSL